MTKNIKEWIIIMSIIIFIWYPVVKIIDYVLDPVLCYD